MRRRSSPPPIGSTSTAAKSNRSWQLCVPSLHRPTCRWVPAVAAQGCHRVGTAAATSSVRPCQGRPPGGLRAPANELADPRSGRERAPTAGSPVPGGVQLLPGRSRYRRARPWSAMLGRYDNWSATRCARCAEFGVTEALPLITGDTVAIETRAAIRDIGYLWATDPASKTAPRLTGVLTNHPVVSGASAESSWKRLPLSLRLGHAASNGREPRRRRETPWRTKVRGRARAGAGRAQRVTQPWPGPGHRNQRRVLDLAVVRLRRGPRVHEAGHVHVRTHRWVVGAHPRTEAPRQVGPPRRPLRRPRRPYPRYGRRLQRR